MLTNEQEEIIGEALLPLFQYLEHSVIVDVAQRILATMAYSRTAEIEAQRLQQLGYSPAKIRKAAMKLLQSNPEFRKEVAKNTLEHKKTVKKLLKEILKAAEAAGGQVMQESADLSYLDDLRTWKQAGKEITDNSYLPQLVEAIRKQTNENMKSLAGSTGFKTMSGFETMENLYRRELDKAMIKVCTGTFSREQVIYDTVHSLADSGLRTIDFSSGYSMQLDTAVKLAVRTGSGQIAAKIMDENITRTGENLVYVSKHWGARNTGNGHANHEQWQGRVYYIKEGEDYNSEAKRIGQDYITDLWRATGYSADGDHENDPLGLHGYNCRHKHYAWFIGSSLPDEDPQPNPVTIDGKTYDYYQITQKMRTLERKIRALKREREAMAALGQDTKEISGKIKQKIKNYQDFCKDAKIKPDINRLRYECKTSDLTKTEAWKKWKEIENNQIKNSTNGEENGIMKSDKTYDKGTIQMIENIEQRNSGKGNANAITHFGTGLNNRQQRLLEKLPEYDSQCSVKKKAVNMSDLSALTAETGSEFAMFTKGKERLIIRGNSTSVNVSRAYAKRLKLQGYRWSGHTHPGTDDFCLMPSQGDKEILNEFEQECTVIYNSVGKWYILEKEEQG